MKPGEPREEHGAIGVAPHAGARIETRERGAEPCRNVVAPHAGAPDNALGNDTVRYGIMGYRICIELVEVL